MTVPEMCLAYLVRTGTDGLEVLLGEKRGGVGAGRVMGVGGPLLPGETSLDAAMRELGEQLGVGVAASGLDEVGTVEYHFPTRPSWSRIATVFVCRHWTGQVAESLAISPAWFRVADLPYTRMWDDAPRWLPGALRGAAVDARYTFGPDLTTVVLEVG